MQSAESSSKIYLVNCLSAIQQPLLGHEVATNYANNLNSTIKTHISDLAEKEVNGILRRCGLLSKISYIQNPTAEDEHRLLAEIDDLSPPAVALCLRNFFGLVTGTGGFLPEFDQLQVPKLRSDACVRVARALAEAYDLFYQAIMDPKNGYPDPKSLMRHSPDQIKTILEI